MRLAGPLLRISLAARLLPPKASRSATTATSARSWSKTALRATVRTAHRAGRSAAGPARRRGGLRGDCTRRPDEACSSSGFSPTTPTRSCHPGSHKSLTAEQKELLRQWVEAGAEYEPHWSFIAPVRPEPPAVIDESWIRNPIDRFVLAKLEELGLKPAPGGRPPGVGPPVVAGSDRASPDPAEVEAFVNDTARCLRELRRAARQGSPRQESIARLLARCGAVCRYARTAFRQPRDVVAYRDWVVRAFNGNVPFDRFTVEQLAGDLLPNPRSTSWWPAASAAATSPPTKAARYRKRISCSTRATAPRATSRCGWG